MKSKIKNVQGAGDFMYNGTQYFSYEYEMETGEIFKAFHKSQGKFSIGDEVEFEITGKDKQGNPKGKLSKPSTYQPRQGGAKTFKADPLKQQSIEMQVCLKEAREYLEHRGYEKTGMIPQLDEIIEAAEYLHSKLFK